jgi:MGT family glycosyltransferase
VPDPAPHVFCVLYPALGHSLPMLPVLAELSRLGCRVTATTGPATADAVRAAGAEPIVYSAPMRAALPVCRTPAELSRALLALLEEVLAVAPDVFAACAEPPDVVMHDIGMALPARVYALVNGRPAVQMLPILASNEHFSVAEVLTTMDGVPVIPAPGTPSRDEPDPTATRYHELLAEFVRRHGSDEPGVTPVGPELNLVLLPREFQPKAETFGPEYVFVGPSPSEANRSWEPPGDGRPVALLSMSTSSHCPPTFFRDTALGLRAAGWHVVVTLGKRVDPAELGALPDGVEVHSWVPLDAVLDHAAAFVSQGGMSSVMAAVRHAVPAVYLPGQPEPMVNARRVEELGLATVLPADTATPEGIVAAAGALAADPSVPRRLAAMRDRAGAGGGPARAAAEIVAHARRYGPVSA